MRSVATHTGQWSADVGGVPCFQATEYSTGHIVPEADVENVQQSNDGSLLLASCLPL
ncbi:hypothetical protein DPMN_166933 [Dreissena polymorpha]|uniref:Uncharacterized protein n=1 Tax=Dreissena polymorpha TaxID=45954 RepID=A0A9D4EXV7_DREPO|nr:hypothetical protein DPMN_166933 [Dreissena polymorpha]